MTRLSRWAILLAVLLGSVGHNGVAAHAEAICVVGDLAYKSGDGLTAYEAERCKLDLYLPEGEKNFGLVKRICGLIWARVMPRGCGRGPVPAF